MQQKPADWLLPMIVGLFCFGMVAFKALWPYFDTDLWWHLRLGEWIIENGRVPTTDSFSRLGLETEKAWLAYSWLFEILIFKIYQYVGFRGIALYRVVMGCVLLAALVHLQARRKPYYMVGLLSLVLTAVILPPILTERPWQFTILFSIWTIDVVISLREGRSSRVHWLLPFVYIVWANLHIQFVYGLFILGLGCVAPVIDRIVGHSGKADFAAQLGSSGWWRLVVLTVLCTAATLVNPYHVKLYGVVFEYATQPAPFTFVDELTAPTFRSLSHWAQLGFFGAAAFALGRRAKVSAFDVLLLAAAAVFAFRAKRDAWFVAAASLAILAISFPETQPVPQPPRKLLTLAYTVLFGIILAGWWFLTGDNRLQNELHEKYPVAAAAHLRDHDYAGPIYNDFNWGGYLIWDLHSYPVSIDGRTNHYGDERIKRAVATTAGLPGWQDDPDLQAARVILLNKQEALAELLRLDPRYQLVYEDEIAVVFTVAAR